MHTYTNIDEQRARQGYVCCVCGICIIVDDRQNMKVIIPSTAQSYVFLSALWFDWSVDDYNQTLQRSSSSRSGIAQFIWSHLYLYSLGGIWRIVSGSLCILVKCLIIAHSGRTDLVHSFQWARRRRVREIVVSRR